MVTHWAAPGWHTLEMQTVAKNVSNICIIIFKDLSSFCWKIWEHGSQRISFFFKHLSKKRSSSCFSSLPLPLSPTVFWLEPKRPPWLIAYRVGSLFLRNLHFSLHTALLTGSLTVTISILKQRGQFPPCSRIWLHNLIANASPVSAPTSGFSFPNPPSVSILTP